MTDKKKIQLIYVGVFVICATILGVSFWLTTLRGKLREENASIVEGAGKEEAGDLWELEKDLDLVKQDGAAVKISDLKNKVWVAAQYYTSCPMCAARNANSLVGVYNEFRDEDDFQVVCFSVDPEEDTQEKLQKMTENLSVDPSNWWFVKADQKPLWEYMRHEMKFGDIRERKDPIEAAAKGKWSHDLGILVFRGNTLVKKWHERLPPEALSEVVKTALSEIKKDKVAVGDE